MPEGILRTKGAQLHAKNLLRAGKMEKEMSEEKLICGNCGSKITWNEWGGMWEFRCISNKCPVVNFKFDNRLCPTEAEAVAVFRKATRADEVDDLKAEIGMLKMGFVPEGMVKRESNQNDPELERAAEKAGRTGNKEDLAEYMKLRRARGVP